jgi:hypothetical protein
VRTLPRGKLRGKNKMRQKISQKYSFLIFIAMLFCVFFIVYGSAPNAVSQEPEMIVMGDSVASPSGNYAFPGCQGFGCGTRAAYGLAPAVNPVLYKVTNLNRSGSGSLRACVEAVGPRICVFEVSGIIEDYNRLNIANPYISIAGQTAPSPGIMLKGTSLRIMTHDVFVSHIRVRPGDGAGIMGENRDGIGISTNSGDGYNVVVDHCSVSWAVDENVELWYESMRDITISNSIISEGLNDSLHPDNPHSKGLLVGRDQRNLSFIGNLFAHNVDRNPVIYNSEAAVINNLVYNSKDMGITIEGSVGPPKASIVGNVVIPGVSSGKYVDYALSIGSHIWSPWSGGGVGSEIYVSDNGCVKCLSSDPWAGVDDRGGLKEIVRSAVPPVWPPYVTVKPSSEVKNRVLAFAGARPLNRDSVDARIAAEVVSGTGKIVDCVDADPLYWPAKTATGGTANTIVLAADDSAKDGRFKGKTVEIVSGQGSGQSRVISDYAGATKLATVSATWNAIPDKSSVYRIKSSCLKNAGGWPTYASATRSLTPPAGMHSDSDSDGYSDLEEWLHCYACELEGQESPNCRSCSFLDTLAPAAPGSVGVR